ncbi:MAG: chitobiase/beta-hexosaminidase C-terminal domain-containing protein [Terracidiphilus sp.]|jgi:hypothetical protein
MKAALLLFVIGSAFACAQDPGMMAAQQAAQQSMMMSQQATQQAMQDMQQASQQAQQFSQQAMQDAQQNYVPSIFTRQPSFSIKVGTVAAGTAVRIKCPTHYAVIYYTTNGWSPTPSSRRYNGPIPITATTELQAIAVAPNLAPSLIARANYTVKGSVQQVFPLTLAADGVLHAGTRLHLITNSTVNSKTAQVGDDISISLNQDIRVGDSVVIPQGTPIDAVITQADPSAHAGTPGDIAFEVNFLTVRGIQIPLQGGEALEGANRYNSRFYTLIPVVGVIPALATHGDEAEIRPGMTFTVATTTNTPLMP